MKTQINCPNCQQPIMADIEQVFDQGVDPTAKSKLLAGQANVAQCAQCGFNGALSTPLVYHDPEKELLLTFTPPEINLPRDEQEKLIGKLINQVVDALPQEQRKGYLFSPQTALTFQGLIERILQEDGISKEMIDDQQKKVNLIQRLAGITDDEALAMVVKEEDDNMDVEFFGLLSQLIQMSASQGDEQGAQLLAGLQEKLLPITTQGKIIQEQSQEIQEAIKILQEVGDKLDQAKLLELVLEAESDVRVESYVSLARPGMDYQFFQLLTEKLDAAEGEEKDRLTAIREKLLALTEKIDGEIQARVDMAMQNVEILLKAEEREQVIAANLPAIDEYFLQALGQAMEQAKADNDEERLEALQSILNTIQELMEASRSGPGSELLQHLLQAEDAEARKTVMDAHAAEVTPEFVEMLTNAMVQLEGSEENQEMAEKIREIYREVLRFSMKSQMNAPAEEE
ncbi:MAG: CpXC domain-containing protein [Chloroflexota bacterium]